MLVGRPNRIETALVSVQIRVIYPYDLDDGVFSKDKPLYHKQCRHEFNLTTIGLPGAEQWQPGEGRERHKAADATPRHERKVSPLPADRTQSRGGARTPKSKARKSSREKGKRKASLAAPTASTHGGVPGEKNVMGTAAAPILTTVERLLAFDPPSQPLPPSEAALTVDGTRQLFVDDGAIHHRTATRQTHVAKYVGIVLAPNADETVVQPTDVGKNYKQTFRTIRSSRPSSGGVWYDELENIYKLFYRCEYIYHGIGRACVAVSRDGRIWWRPNVTDSRRPTRAQHGSMRRAQRRPAKTPWSRRLPNELVGLPHPTDGFTVWLDAAEGATSRSGRWKMMLRPVGSASSKHLPATLCVSDKGYEWSCNGVSGPVTDRASFFYNPYSKSWAFSLRGNLCRGGVGPDGHMRVSRYAEARDFANVSWAPYQHARYSCAEWRKGEPLFWLGADRYDCEPPQSEASIKRGRGEGVTHISGGESAGSVPRCDLYHVDATPYESVLIGQMAITRPLRNLYEGCRSASCMTPGLCKDTSIYLGFSRDGLRWTRTDPPRTPMYDAPLRYALPVAGNFLLDPSGESLLIYYGGASSCRFCNIGRNECPYGNASRDGPVTMAQSTLTEVTALATLRRDGFVSLQGPSPSSAGSGTALTSSAVTRMLLFSRGDLFVNAACTARGGAILVGLLNATTGRELPDFSAADCSPVLGDSTRNMVRWRGVGRGRLNGIQGVRAAFKLGVGCSLYAFWSE